MDHIKNLIKRIFQPTTVSGSWGLPKVSGYAPMPIVKPPKEEEELYMNMTPKRCGECKWIYRFNKMTYKCYYNPPQVVYRDDFMNSYVNSVRPTVLKRDKACSKFDRNSNWADVRDCEDLAPDDDGGGC